MIFSSRSRRFSGVTLVEMLIGVAVLGVLLAVAVPSLSDMLEKRRVVAAAGEIAGMFAYARSDALAVGDKINLHMEPVPDTVGSFSCMRVTTDDATDSCGCARKLTKVCSIGGAKLLREYRLPRDSSVSFSADADWSPANPYVVQFLRGKYFADVNNVQVTVVGARTKAKLRVNYLSSGRVSTCSPDGSIGGFPTCKEAAA